MSQGNSGSVDRALNRTLPVLACDCHTHIFGPSDQFPPSVASIYALPDAAFEVHRATREANGLDRAVLIQPAPYGQDPSAMLDGLNRSGSELRGVGSARSDIGDAALARMDQAGICALRFLEARTPAGERYVGSVEIDELAP